DKRSHSKLNQKQNHPICKREIMLFLTPESLLMGKIVKIDTINLRLRKLVRIFASLNHSK
ncbi:MAG: hypothetical protein L0G05_06260, partial [Chryseobacterium sp.]|nr:hypothetical protein [Chryseobacterium sp.]